MKDIDEVVYWHRASLFDRIVLFPWFVANYFISLLRGASPLHAIKWWLINVAQSRDVEEHTQRLAYACRRHPKVPKIAWGVSRGAATTFCSLALMSQASRKDVKLAIIEGCFDSVPNLLKARYGSLLACICQLLLSFFTEYDITKSRSMSPLALASRFPHDIPIAFISSNNDKTVPRICSKRLYEAVKQSGHPHAFFLTLETKGHNEYYTGQDAVLYDKFIKNLLKRFSV